MHTVRYLRSASGGDADGERVGAEQRLVGAIGSHHLRALLKHITEASQRGFKTA